MHGWRVPHRSPIPYRDVEERLQDWGEVMAKLPAQEHADLLSTQSARCMGCGTPFCHQTSTGARAHAFYPFILFHLTHSNPSFACGCCSQPCGQGTTACELRAQVYYVHRASFPEPWRIIARQFCL